MKSKEQQVTAIVRAMKKCLKKDHGIVVPHAALRAAYLQAGGINPHAFSAQVLTTDPVQESAVATEPGVFGRVFHLVEDNVGCLSRLALDAEGELCVPDTWVFTNAAVSYLYATIPSVKKYGMPDYLVKQSNFFPTRFPGLALAKSVKFEYHDTGDDTGDRAVLAISMSDTEWQALLYEIAKAEGLLNDAKYEIALHYRIDWSAAANKGELLERYLLSSNFITPSTGVVDCSVEWVYPDEDSDNVEATVDLSTGRVVLKAEPEQDLRDQRLRVRVMAFDYPFAMHWTETAGWVVPFSDAYDYGLVELRQYAGEFES